MLSSLLRQVFGPDTALDGYTVGNRRDDYIVLLARLRSPDLAVVIKLAGPGAPIACPFEQTSWVHSLVRAQTSVPVAAVIAADTSYSQWPWRYMIKEYVDGVEWASLQSQLNDERTMDIYTQIAYATAELHNVTFARFGDLPVDKDAWQTEDFAEALRERARRRIKNSRHFEIFSRVLGDREGLSSDVSQPCLCHEDLHKHNIIFRQEGDSWKLVNILDFDSAWAGCHETDLARLQFWNSNMAERFLISYKEMHPVAEGYAERRSIYQLLWCLEYAFETPKHLKDTRRVCAELGIAPIESFVEEA